MDPAVRERLLEAVLSELGRKGREAMVLAQVLRTAEVAEKDFAEEYGDLDTCLDAAYVRLTARLDDAMRVGCSADGKGLAQGEPQWPQQVRGGLEAVLSELAEKPALARALTRGYPSLGPTQQARYLAFIEGFAAELRARRQRGGIDGELPANVDSLAVGAAEAIVFEEISSARTESLPKMAPPILFSLLVPFLGPGGAITEMEKAQDPR